jgi:3-hydroxyisobutyrate dehydrogenase-like beta-hydroxyacid dehydrogenase
MASIALLGTGLLGSGIVQHFLKTGTAVTVWNRTEAKARALERDGAKVAATPEAAVAGADRIHFVLPDDAVVDGLLERVAPALAHDAIVVDHSTTLPGLTKKRVDRARRLGVAFLHAPVFMSPQMAADGVGLILASGPQAVFDQVRADLEGMTGEVWYLGERPDLASAYKLFGNAMLFAISAGMADVIAMARANDIDPLESLSIFSKFQPAKSIQGRGPKMATGDYAPSFTLEMARKDVGLMIAAARGQKLVALPAVAKRMDEVIASGGRQLDVAAIADPAY